MGALLKNKSDLGKLMILIGLLTLVPIIVLPFYEGEGKYFIAFLTPSACSIVIGALVCVFVKSSKDVSEHVRTVKRGSLTVLLGWLFGIATGAVPFLFLGLNVMQSLFESASGWTTTGFTVVDITRTPKVFIFHRSFMQFCGGLGFILMMAMVIQDKHSMSLFSFEGHTDQLTPSVLKTARTVFLLYSAIFLFGTILLLCCGMSLFDSVIHCMSALSTGGFSSKALSIGAYNSVAIELATVIIMLLGMTNFAVLMLLARRKVRQALRVSEVKTTFVVLGGIVVLVAIILSLSMGVLEGTRQSVFNVVSVLSTTGFSTIDYNQVPAAALVLIVVAMLVGGAAGSTAGGIKLNRVYLLFRGAEISVVKRLSPENMVDARFYHRPQGKCEIDNALLRDTYAYAFMYLLILIATALLLCFTANASLANALFEAASLSGTVGVSVGIFSQTANAATLLVGIIGMIIARLEINIILTGILTMFSKG